MTTELPFTWMEKTLVPKMREVYIPHPADYIKTVMQQREQNGLQHITDLTKKAALLETWNQHYCKVITQFQLTQKLDEIQANLPKNDHLTEADLPAEDREQYRQQVEGDLLGLEQKYANSLRDLHDVVALCEKHFRLAIPCQFPDKHHGFGFRIGLNSITAGAQVICSHRGLFIHEPTLVFCRVVYQTKEDLIPVVENTFNMIFPMGTCTGIKEQIQSIEKKSSSISQGMHHTEFIAGIIMAQPQYTNQIGTFAQNLADACKSVPINQMMVVPWYPNPLPSQNEDILNDTMANILRRLSHD